MNKVSTKVEMRFVVSEAEWLPYDVRLRLARQEKGRMNNKGELVVTAQEFRQEFFYEAHTAVVMCCMCFWTFKRQLLVSSASNVGKLRGLLTFCVA